MMSQGPPSTPAAGTPPIEIETPISPVMRWIEPGNVEFREEPEGLARKLFASPGEEPSARARNKTQVGISTELQKHIHKLVDLLQKESDEVTEYAEKRKQALKAQWAQDCTEMEKSAQTIMTLLNRMFEKATSRSDELIENTGLTMEEFQSMSRQYQNLLLKLVEATAVKLSSSK
jgi:hypothetical protein